MRQRVGGARAVRLRGESLGATSAGGRRPSLSVRAVVMVTLAVGVVVATGLLPRPCAARPASQPADGSRARLAVMDVQTTGVGEELTALLTEVLATEVHSLGRYDVLTGPDIEAMLGVSDLDQMVGCTDVECLLDVGGALGVAYLLAAHVGRVGRTHVVHIKLINMALMRAERRTYESIRGDDDVLLGTLRRSARRIFTDAVGDVEAATVADGTADLVADADALTMGEGGALQLQQEASEAGLGVGVGLVSVALLCAGAASAGTGVYMGIRSQQHYNASRHSNGVGQQHELREAIRYQRRANIAYGVGAAASVAGALWWFFSDPGNYDNAVAGEAVPAEPGSVAPGVPVVPVVSPDGPGVFVAFGF